MKKQYNILVGLGLFGTYLLLKDRDVILLLNLDKQDGEIIITEDRYHHEAIIDGAVLTSDGRYFRGQGDKIILPDIELLKPTSQMTLEVVFNPAQTDKWGGLLGRFSWDYKGYLFSHSKSLWWVLNTGGQRHDLILPRVIEAGNQYYAAFIYNGSTMDVLLGGELIGSIAANGEIVYNNAQQRIIIGGDDYFKYPLNGSIKFIRMRNTAASHASIKNMAKRFIL